MIDKFNMLETYQKILLLGGVFFILLVLTLGTLIMTGTVNNPFSSNNTDKIVKNKEVDKDGSDGTHNLGGNTTSFEGVVDSTETKLSTSTDTFEVKSIKEDGVGRLIITSTKKKGKSGKEFVYDTSSLVFDGKTNKLGSSTSFKKGEKIKVYTYEELKDTTGLSSEEASKVVNNEEKEVYIKTAIVNEVKGLHYVEPTDIYRTNDKLYYVDNKTKTRYVANRGIKSKLVGDTVDVMEKDLKAGQLMFFREGKAGTGNEFNDEIEAEGGSAGNMRPDKIKASSEVLNEIKKTRKYKTVEVKDVYVNDIIE